MERIGCRAFLFDLDGVLIDSTPAVIRVWHRWALEHGFDPEDVIRRAHGRPSLTTIREFLPDADHDFENRIVERAEIEDLEGVVPMPGARELVERLSDERWAIVTSGTRPLAEARLRASGLPRPSHMVTATDITHGKPDAEPYLKGAAILGFTAESCIVMEDAPAGVVSGKKSGARVIAVRTTAPDSELHDAGADWIVDDCRAISLLEFSAEQELAFFIRNNSAEKVSSPAKGFEATTEIHESKYD